jgi:hypothetical protein
MENAEQARNQLRRGHANPLPQMKSQLKKARKAKRHQEAKNTAETSRPLRPPKIKDQVVANFSQD